MNEVVAFDRNDKEVAAAEATFRREKLKHGANELHRAATDLLGSLRDSVARQRYTDLALRRAAFAAFEADRDDLRPTGHRVDAIFYVLFLSATALSPLFVVLLFEKTDRDIAWDFFGIASTVFLLIYTYGFYTLEMLYRLFSGIVDLLKRVIWLGADPTVPDEEPEPETSGASFFAVCNIVLLFAGLLVAFLAYEAVIQMFALSAAKTFDLAAYNGTYIGFFKWVMALSLLFVIMDLHVARNERSHAETFVASSSAAYATIPMFIGIVIMAVYLSSEYVQAHYFSHLDHPAAMRALSVEFVSGALSFQMIMSNVLFVLMKLNWLLRVAYMTIDTSESR